MITSGGYAGGAFGQAIGGEVTSVHLNELASISAGKIMPEDLPEMPVREAW